MTTFATCALGCDFEVECFTDEQKARVEKSHRVRHHGETLPPVQQLASVVERDRFIEAARTLAATGREFVLSDLPDVEHNRTAKGQLAKELHRLGICHPVGYERSRRKGTKASAVAVWSADRDRCIECPRRVVTA